jgi:lysophospholipase L1-like esterase
MTHSRSAPRTDSHAATVLLRLGAVLLGLGLVALAEVGARALALAPPPPPVLPDGARVAHQRAPPSLERDPETDWRSTGRAEVRDRRAHDLRFPPTPAEGRVRVFTFGGSATLGVPIEATPARTWPGRLEHHLREAGVPAEVLNLGGASYDSSHARALVAEAAELGPTVLVVYSGNNEFFAYDLELWEVNRGRSQAHIERLHLLRLLRRLVRPDPPPPDPTTVNAAVAAQEQTVQGAIADLVAGLPEDALPDPTQHHRRDPIFTTVVARYEANLRAMATSVAAAQAPDGAAPLLLIVDVPANLAVAPELSLPDPRHPLAAARGARARAQARDETRSAADRCEDWHAAVQADPRFAESWYQRGLCRAQSSPQDPDQRAGWKEDLQAALALDYDPRRPPPAFSDAVLRVAEGSGAERIELGAALFSPPPGQPSPFHDRCHLTAEAQDAIGAALAEEVRTRLALRPAPSDPSPSPNNE